MLRGEIYLAKLDPVIGSEVSKTRPVLILSNNINNTYSQTISVIPISSSIDVIYPFEVFISNADSGLLKDSKIKTNQIRTIDKQRLIKYLGKISEPKLILVEKALLIHLGINLT
jgi:mRNA interferase MazF